MPGGMYRNQFWFPYPGDNVMTCIGIHGQMIYVNRSANMVAAKLSSWPYPQDASKIFPTIAASTTSPPPCTEGVRPARDRC